jgi:hypothetical protein
MGRQLLAVTSVLSLFLLTIAISGCGIQYVSEKFTFKINPDGSGKLAVKYINLGSKEERTHLRNRDLRTLQDSAHSKEIIEEARAKGVKIIERHLEFVDFSLNGIIEATSSKYMKIFDVFTNYTFEIDDRIYITPHNGTVTKAELSEGGEIVVRNNQYSFTWPIGTSEMSFTASYKIKGASFSYEYQKKYRNK